MTSSLQKNASDDKKLRSDISSFKAFQRLLLPLVRTGTDTFHTIQVEDASDAMHRLRVTLRRLRSLLWAFEDNLPAGRARYWREQLAQAADVAGAARVLDVIIEDTLPQAEQAIATPVNELRNALEQERDQQRALSVQQLKELELEQLLQQASSTQQLLERVQWRHPSRKTGNFAEQKLDLARHDLAKRIRQLDGGQLQDLHRVRIAIKRLRYLTEFFGPVLKKKQKKQLRSLVRLQARLGVLNDQADARARLALLPENSTAAPEIARVKDWLDTSIRQQTRLLKRRLRNDRRLSRP